MLRIIPIILVTAGAAFAGLDPGKAVSQYVHDVWHPQSGLPHNTVTVITQSRDGYLWLGTEEGVARFDGVAFTTFNTENTPLKNNVVLSVREDRQGALWIGTNGGLTRIRSGQDKTFTTKDGLAGDVVTSLCEDREGNLWVGTDGGGVSRLRNGAIQNYGTAQGLPAGAVFAIAESRQGDLWFATAAGLARWNREKFEVVSGLPNHDIRALLPEPDGALWIGTNGGGVVRLDHGAMTTYTTRNGLHDNAIRSILRDSEGTLWVAALDSGLHRFHDGRFELAVSADPPSARDVLSLFEDREGSLWLGAIGSGLHRYRDSKVTALAAAPGSTSETVLGIFEDRGGALWLGARNGVNRWKDGKVTSYTPKQGLSDPRVFSIAEDRDGDIWIGTRDGLNRLHRGRIKVFTTADGLPSNTIPAILSDRQGRLWIATRKGLCRWDNGRFITYTTADGLANNFVISLRDAADGSLWVGTAGGGASRFQDGRFTSYGAKEGLSNGVVFDILADADGAVWLGTSGGGLNRWKNGRITAITTREGLFDNTVFRILEDGQNRLWLSSNRGVSHVDRKALNDLADGRIRSIRSSSFGQADGMKSQECNGGFQPAGWKGRDGKLYFPTTSGAVEFDPTRVQANTQTPTVTLEQATLNGHPAGVNAPVDVPPGPGSLEFHYSAPTFLAPKKIAFRYRLEGFDPEWVEAGSRREAYYTNIPPGAYRFRVIAANEDGVWNEAGVSTAFVLRPQFGQTGAFRALCFGVFLLALAGIYQLRVRGLHARQKELSLHVEERTRELQEQIVARDLAHSQLKDAQQRMIELSRQSGMAEVATGVLHNVGNVLNSVNVSATIVAGKVKDSHVENLVALVDMLQRNAHDLEGYLRRDPKGQRVISYLSKLGNHFQQERQLLLKEVGLLTDHVQHVKEIVATQQNYAKVCGMIDQLSLPDLVDDAFRMVQPSLDRHHVALDRDFEDVPLIMGDKHLILQILLNLLRNAKEAIKLGPNDDRRIRVRIARQADDRVQIQVTDSGIGLPHENLTRIFAHGFTTKEGGHGFGLHSGALAAQQMGGSLRAESDGPGCGATFTLELPLEAQMAVQHKTAA